MNAPLRHKRPRVRTREQPIHEGIVQFLKFRAAPGVVYFCVPNGEYRRPQTVRKLAAQGVRAGVADLALVLPGGRAAFLEVKSSHGRQSPEQRRFEEDVTGSGALYACARSIDEARAILTSWGALRASPEGGALRASPEGGDA